MSHFKSEFPHSAAHRFSLRIELLKSESGPTTNQTETALLQIRYISESSITSTSKASSSDEGLRTSPRQTFNIQDDDPGTTGMGVPGLYGGCKY
jgi:hypothetical protein